MLLTCEVPDDLAARLAAAARAEHRSKSEIVRESLEARLRVSEANKQVTAWDLVKHLAGSVHGDPNITDLATNPEHMRDFGK